MWLLVKGDGESPHKLVNLARIEHICITNGEEKDTFNVVAYRYQDGAGEQETDWQEFILFSLLYWDEANAAVELLAELLGKPMQILPGNDQTLFIRPRR